MARGFESKSVADQQASAFEENRGPGAPAEDPAVQTKRRKLELSRASVLQQLELARAEPHKQMLKTALEDLDRQISALDRAQ